MKLVTYRNVTPDAIREGDRVQDDIGRDFYALSDAQYNENSQTYDVLDNNRRWISYDFTESVTITYEDVETDAFAY